VNLRCPSCGAPVRVVHGGGGTHWYEPVAATVASALPPVREERRPKGEDPEATRETGS
jgi:hypothetical protein